MRRKPRLHDGIVTIDLGKNRVAEIPCSGSDAPDDGFTRSASARNATITSKKESNVRLQVNCACTFGTRDLWLHQNGFVLAIHGIVASQKCRSSQYVVKRAERSYYDESDVVL